MDTFMRHSLDLHGMHIVMHGLFMIEETENFTRYISAEELSSILKSRGASTQDSPNSKTTHILLGLLDREDRSSMVWTNSKLYVEQEEARRGRAGAAGPIYDHIQFISDTGIKQSVDQATHIARFRPDPTKPKKAPPPPGPQRTRGRIMSATLTRRRRGRTVRACQGNEVLLRGLEI